MAQAMQSSDSTTAARKENIMDPKDHTIMVRANIYFTLLLAKIV